ncbi:MAG: ATP-binding cassette domain-containing protein [Pseudomonadota bacterium]
MLVAEQLHKTFPGVVAVEDVSFTARDGAITGLLGPNGAGKSTTLRMLYAQLKPTTGSAIVDGINVHRDPAQARSRLGVLPHQSGLYKQLTARENVRYYGQLHGMQGEVLEQRIEELLGLLDLEHVADRRTEGFSQGEKTKVGLARAMVHGPANLLLDEPTNGLDVMATRAMRELIRRFRDEGCCVVFSSHIMQEVSALCDEVVIVSGGRVAASGTPDALRERAGTDSFEEAFVRALGTSEGLM